MTLPLPKPVKVAISGYGRIGRCVHRQALATPDIAVIAHYSRGDAASRAHLLKYDSLFGTLALPVSVEGETVIAGEQRSASLTGEVGKDFRWDDLGVEIVIEASGAVRDFSTAEKHLAAGAKKVLITAPSEDPLVPTYVMGVNDAAIDTAARVVSNASCTTNCLAPLAKLFHTNYGVVAAQMTTVHAATSDQQIHDNSHADWRRARAFLPSIIPTKTGVASALKKVLPEIADKFEGLSLRVPTLTVSCVDLTVELANPVAPAEINALCETAAAGELAGILGVSRVPLVSTDFRGDSRSCVVDAELTRLAAGKLLKIIAWYDNEWGYSARVLDLVRKLVV